MATKQADFAGFKLRVNGSPTKQGVFAVNVAIVLKRIAVEEGEDREITIKRDVSAKTALRWAKDLLKRSGAPAGLVKQVEALQPPKLTRKRRTTLSDPTS